MFSFTSPGMKFDTHQYNGRGPPTLRLQGQTYHRIGTLLPKFGHLPQYAQLYIYDTDNEIENRMNCFRENKVILRDIFAKLKNMLDDFNVHAKAFRMAQDMLENNAVLDLKLMLIYDRQHDGPVYNMPTVSEVAALIVGDIDTGSHRDIIVQAKIGELQRIDEFHPAYLAYQYPLIFTYGEDGYRNNVLHRYHADSIVTKKTRQTIKDWLSFRLQQRKHEAGTLLHSRRLFQQFLVDGYTMMESERLNWLRKNQSKLRVGKYRQLNDQTGGPGLPGPGKTGKRVVLPSSFVGSRRYMDQLYFDGMEISSHLGFPDLFITFTCNPSWHEISRILSNTSLRPHDRPDIISRIFKIKLDQLLFDITKRHLLGKVVAFMYTVEFQKRGLPHSHILIFLDSVSKYLTPSDIDKVISAEIPDPDQHPALYNLVKAHMMHGPCGLSQMTLPCMKKGRCSKYYPKKYTEETTIDSEGYPHYRRRSNGHGIYKNGITLDNRHVVPYNIRFLLKYRAHINMEWCNQSTSIKYLFKYIHKGYDRITAAITAPQTNDVDEIKQYMDCRYVSPSEGCLRIFGYSIHGRKPVVERMYYHLVGEKPVYYTDFARMENVLEKSSVTESMFTAWFATNAKYAEASFLTYEQFSSKFVYVKKTRLWKPRQKGFTIGRLIWVPPTTGELFYLRMMLTVAKGPTCYEDIRKINNIQLDTFRDAYFAMGFLEDDQEYVGAITEAAQWGTGHFLRKIFVVMLLSGAVNRPFHVWTETWLLLADNLLHEQRRLAQNPELDLCEMDLQNLTLIEIKKLLQANRRSLTDFKPIPYPDGYVLRQLGNRLIYEERQYNVGAMKTEFEQLFSTITIQSFVFGEQKMVYHRIIDAVAAQKGGIYFLHGHGGTGKTYMWKILASPLRSRHEICLTVATSGIASLLLPGGRTTRSKFKIPVPTLENSTCNINYNDDVADLLRQTRLIIWDEVSIAHKYALEALDRTLRDIMSSYGGSDNVFGGKVVVFGGDFRQILFVVPRGSRSDIVHSALNASYIWHSVQVLTLTGNMRLTTHQSQADVNEIQEFSKWLLDIGEGKLSEPNDGVADIHIPPELLITDYTDPIVAIVRSTYPDFIHNYGSNSYLKNRAILASTLKTVDEIKDHVLTLMPGEIREYYSSNSVDKSDIHDLTVIDILTPEFLSSLSTYGLPNHHIKIKVGTPIMLMRNIDQSEGLCNETRLLITKMATHVLEATVMARKGVGNSVYIPIMDMSPSQSP